METNGLELPKRKVEYLKFLGEAGGPVKTSMIAERFRIDPSTVTKSMNELAAAGFVVHTPYHGVELSEKGRRYTGFLVKRHRILSLMLTHFGFSDQEACREVSRFESLCGMLTLYAGALPTTHFADRPHLRLDGDDQPLGPSALRTSWRQAEQLWSNLVQERAA